MSKIKSLFQVLILVALIGTASSALPINSAMAEADTTAPTISAISFANKTGTVTDSGIALNLFEATDADLATAGSITVSRYLRSSLSQEPMSSQRQDCLATTSLRLNWARPLREDRLPYRAP